MDRVHDMLLRLRRGIRAAHHYIGETYRLLKLPDLALASFEHAADLPGAGPPTWMELARLYECAHRLDEAEELIERTVRAGIRMPLVALVRGRIQRRQKRLDEAEATFRELIQRISDRLESGLPGLGRIGADERQRGRLGRGRFRPSSIASKYKSVTRRPIGRRRKTCSRKCAD